MHPAPEGANDFIYTLLVYIHILSGMIAIGFNFTYVVWIQRGKRDRDTLIFALKGVKFLDDYIANPLYIIAGISGVLMILMGKAVASWLWIAIIIYGVVMLIAYLVYTPLLSRQIRLLAEKGMEAPEYRQIANRSNVIGAMMGMAVIIIVALKIFEPTF
jgi:hypothetical protein